MDNFIQKFKEEAADQIEELEKSLLAIEHTPNSKPLINVIFRIMHTLKGSAAMFGFDKITDVTHHLESIYEMIRDDKLSLSREILDLTLEAVDHLKLILSANGSLPAQAEENHQRLCLAIDDVMDKIQKTEPLKDVINIQENGNSSDSQMLTYHIFFKPEKDIFRFGTNPLYLIDELNTLGNCLVFPNLEDIPDFEDLDPNTCYVSWDVYLATEEDQNQISDVFIFVEDSCELTIDKIAENDILSDENIVKEIKEKRSLFSLQEENAEKFDIIHNINTTTLTAEAVASQAKIDQLFSSKEATISSIRVSSDKLDQLLNLVSELVTTQARLSLFSESQLLPELAAISENVQKLTRQLRDNAFSICLIPIQTLMTRFQRLVRDLASDLGKDVLFAAEGMETELDKSIIESLTDPILHILRNSIDHGIETKAERLEKGKPAQGKILIKAFYSGANVHIQIHDDGRGISLEVIKTKAIEKGLIAPDANMTSKEILDLVFLPGFSTAQSLSDISGRGVGMDVVKRKISDIRGEVEIESLENVGTTITVKIPLTLSIIDGLLTKIDDTHFILPLSVVNQIYAVTHKQIMESKNNLIVINGQTIPFYYLRQEFDIPYQQINDKNTEQVIMVSYQDGQVGLILDTVIGEYQAVLKPLGKMFKNQEEVSGASILGDGTIALVLDTQKLIKKYSLQTHIITN